MICSRRFGTGEQDGFGGHSRWASPMPVPSDVAGVQVSEVQSGKTATLVHPASSCWCCRRCSWCRSPATSPAHEVQLCVSRGICFPPTPPGQAALEVTQHHFASFCWFLQLTQVSLVLSGGTWNWKDSTEGLTHHHCHLGRHSAGEPRRGEECPAGPQHRTDRIEATTLLTAAF